MPFSRSAPSSSLRSSRPTDAVRSFDAGLHKISLFLPAFYSSFPPHFDQRPPFEFLLRPLISDGNDSPSQSGNKYSGFLLLYSYWMASGCTRWCELAGEWLPTHNPMGIGGTDVTSEVVNGLDRKSLDVQVGRHRIVILEHRGTPADGIPIVASPTPFEWHIWRADNDRNTFRYKPFANDTMG
jgi:hypothetical protein